jgi:hypothetical protein
MARIRRRLIPGFRLCLSVVLGLTLVSSALPAAANTLVVTSSADGGPGSLRQALTDAGRGDTIVFDPLVSVVQLTSGELVVNKDLSISGPITAPVVISALGASRIFSVTAGSTVTLSGLFINSGVDPTGGGGIYNAGVLTVTDSTVFGNGAGLGLGGGLYNTGTLTLIAVTVGLNSAVSGGGGLYNAGALTLTNSAVYSSTAFSGGGVYNTGTLMATGSAVYGNETLLFPGGPGAGIANHGVLTLTNSSVYSNTAGSGGGGIDNHGLAALTDSAVYNNSAITGGGVSNDPVGALSLVNTTLSGNGGGGLFVGGGVVTLNNVTLTNNTDVGLSVFTGITGTLPVARNSIFAGNEGGNCSLPSPLVSEGYNLEDDNSCGLGATGDLINTFPWLGPLADNGGGTLTHALLVGSPAIDGGNPASPGAGGNSCAATDQRGIARPQGLRCDIGALEATLQVALGAPFALIPKTAGVFTATVRLNFAPPAMVTVDYATHEGTALAGMDYVTTTGTLTFTPGVVWQTVPVPILNNPANTTSRALSLALSDPTGATLGAPESMTLLIAAEAFAVFLPLIRVD